MKQPEKYRVEPNPNVYKKFGEKTEEQNKKITHWLWIIFVSMITALITTYLATGSTII